MQLRKIYIIFRIVISDDGNFYIYNDNSKPELIEVNKINGKNVYLVFYKIDESRSINNNISNEYLKYKESESEIHKNNRKYINQVNIALIILLTIIIIII